MQEPLREPMRIDVSQVNGYDPPHTHGLPLASPDPPSAGFTAVNGMKPRNSSFRPEEIITTGYIPPEREPTHRSTSGPTQYHAHGWRPADSNASNGRIELQQRQSPITGKRKRTEQANAHAIDNSQLASPPHDQSESPKRRLTTLDSAVDLTSPETQNQPPVLESIDSDLSDQGQMGTYQREKTPVERWNQGDPPPKPRPETEASLAASLHQFQQQNQQLHEAQQARLTSPRDLSPPEDLDDSGEAQGHSDDQFNADNSDPKRRKRNFSNRTKTGCHTCRSRKKKCDEGKPTCQNCDRSGHECQGYGPKPPGGLKPVGQSRTVIPLQSKTPMAPYNGRSSDTPSRDEGGLSYSHWGRVPPPPPEPEPPRQYVPVAPAAPPEPRRPGTADNWQKSAFHPHEHSSSYPNERPPPPPNFSQPPTFSQPPPLQPPYPHDHRQHSSPFPPPSHPYPPPPHQQQHPPPPSQFHQSAPPALPVPFEPWHTHSMQPYHPNGPPSLVSSKESVHSGSHRSGAMQMSYSGRNQQIEKDKMLRGQPFLHYLDQALLLDRQSCKAAVERYNKAAEMTSGISLPERSKLFTQILKPHKRADAKNREQQHHSGPIGSVGDHTIVETPFKCEYGYNIHIGKDCIIESGSYLQDAADICIGQRVVIGHNVKLYCLTASIDSSARKGSQGNLIAGAIKIEDDCFIGADVVVLPFVTIHKGAVVGAGSVVTKDVEENTVVAGNPAKLVRRIEGSNTGRHHSQQIQRQQDGMLHWMRDYANNGFVWYTSPRL